VLTLRAAGKSRKDVAYVMGISEHTVRTHIARAYTKLEVASLLDALRALELLS